MSVNRSRLGWGVFFIFLGTVPLAVAAGVVDAAQVARLATLWPLVLIALGVGLMLRFGAAHTAGGLIVAGMFGLILGAVISAGVRGSVGVACTPTGSSSTPVTASGAFEQGGRIDAELSCVDLTVDSQPGTAWAVAASADSLRQPRIDQSATSLILRSEPERFFGSGPKLAWHVTLPQQSPVSIGLTMNAAGGKVSPGPARLGGLSFTLNASEVDFALGELTALGSFSGTLNASNSTLTLPNTPNANGSITVNASSLRLCVSPAANVQIQLSETLSGNNFASAGLAKSGDRWITPDAAAGAPLVSLNVTTNLSSVLLDRTGGCQ